MARADLAGSDEDRRAQDSAADVATVRLSHGANNVGRTERGTLNGAALDAAARISESSNWNVPAKTLWDVALVPAPVAVGRAGSGYPRVTPSPSLHAHGRIWGFGPQPDAPTQSEELGEQRGGAALSLVVFHIYSDSPGLHDTLLNNLRSVESSKLPTCNTGLVMKPTLTANLQFRMQVRIYFQGRL
jgi:hypothetical protein